MNDPCRKQMRYSEEGLLVLRHHGFSRTPLIPYPRNRLPGIGSIRSLSLAWCYLIHPTLLENLLGKGICNRCLHHASEAIDADRPPLKPTLKSIPMMSD